MLNDLSQFIDDEAGAVTVDWVVLTAGVMAMAMVILSLTFGGATDLSSEIGSTLSQQTVGI